MIDLYTLIIEPTADKLNGALIATTQGGGYVYNVNNNPINTHYYFDIQADTNYQQRSTTEIEALHKKGIYPICAAAKITPVSLNGAVKSAYNAAVDVSISFAVPLYQFKDGEVNEFLREFRLLIDDTLSESTFENVVDGAATYQINTQYNLVQTGERAMRDTYGDSVEFTLYIECGIVASGISSDAIELYIDTERIYTERAGFSRKSVKDLGTPANSASQKSFENSSLFVINFDLPARFSTNPTAGNTSFNAKVAARTFSGTNTTMAVQIKYPITISISGEQTVTTYGTYNYTMQFDTTGINAETGLPSSHSITLMEV